MLDFMRAGGFGMWPVLVLGCAAIAVATRNAMHSPGASLRRLLAISIATVFAMGMAAASDLAAVMSKVPNHPEWAQSPNLHLVVMVGLGESMSPLIFGCLLLTLAWLVAAVSPESTGGRDTAALRQVRAG